MPAIQFVLFFFLNTVSFQGVKFVNVTTVKREGVSTLAL